MKMFTVRDFLDPLNVWGFFPFFLTYNFNRFEMQVGKVGSGSNSYRNAILFRVAVLKRKKNRWSFKNPELE